MSLLVACAPLRQPSRKGTTPASPVLPSRAVSDEQDLNEIREPEAAAPRPAGDGRSLVRLAAGFYGLVALFAFGFALFSKNLGTLLGEKPPYWSHVLASIGIGLVLVALSRVGVRVWSSVAGAATELARLLGPLTTGQALLLALFSSVAEELLFRGALWPHLGLVGTTCLFALVHVIPRRALWFYPIFAGVAGLLLGVLREGSESVIPPILTHFVINALNLMWLGANHERLVGAPEPAGADDAQS